MSMKRRETLSERLGREVRRIRAEFAARMLSIEVRRLRAKLARREAQIARLEDQITDGFVLGFDVATRNQQD